MNKIKEFLKNISPLNNRTDMPPVVYVIKVIIIFWFVKLISELAGEGIVIGTLFAFGKDPLHGDMFEPDIMMLIMYFGYAIFIGIMILYWKLFQKKTPAQLGFTKKAGTYLIGAAAGMVLIAISVAFVMVTGALTCNGLFSNINSTYILLMFAGFIFQGAMEEVLCRGIVLQLLKDKINVHVAVAISTALFVIPHISNMEGVSPAITVFAIINLILISLIFSVITIRFKSIWAACGLHSVWNFILYNVLGMNLSGNDEATAAIFDMRFVGSNLLNGGEYGIEASAVTAVVLAVVLTAGLLVFRKYKTHSPASAQT